MSSGQDKQKEIDFFDGVARSESEYNVFEQAANIRIIDRFAELTGLGAGARVADLGCGSGVFTDELDRRGYAAEGVDISPRLIEVAREKYPRCAFHVGDVEALPFEDAAFDGILLSGLVHHFPDPSPCAREVARVLRPGGAFMAFDPNRMNPFMYLYRDRSSPLYSPIGVTENERPVLAGAVRGVFEAAGLESRSAYLHGLAYRYVESERAQGFLPIYNALDKYLFGPGFMAPLRPFVLTHGRKPETMGR